MPSNVDDRRLVGRGAYALPSVFTAGTLFCGYYAIMKTIQAIALPAGSVAEAAALFDVAAIAIGIAVFTDGMDGRIARLTHSVSDFGRELDSLADVITFGVAPALLAFAWGVRAIEPAGPSEHMARFGYFLAFAFIVCGASRLARFNIQQNPTPKNPGRAGRKYFVGLPIPSAAAMLASVVHASGGYPLRSWMPWGILWLALLGLVSFLMVCTWRYYSFKDLNLLQQRSWLMVVLIAMTIYLVWNFSRPVLVTMATLYVSSGPVIRIGGLLRHRTRHLPQPEQQLH